MVPTSSLCHHVYKQGLGLLGRDRTSGAEGRADPLVGVPEQGIVAKRRHWQFTRAAAIWHVAIPVVGAVHRIKSGNLSNHLAAWIRLLLMADVWPKGNRK